MPVTTETDLRLNFPKIDYGKLLSFLFLLGLMLQTPGCLSVDENIYKVSYATQKKIDYRAVEIIYSQPAKKIIIFGDISIRYNAGYNRNVAISYLKKAAAKKGADGIILNPVKKVDDKWSVSNTSTEDSQNIHLETYILSGSMFQYLPE